jgi:hypothetical protein
LIDSRKITFTDGEARVMRMSDIKPELVNYLFYPYTARTGLTIVCGEQGNGETWIVLFLAALVSRGKPLDHVDTNPFLDIGMDFAWFKKNHLSQERKPEKVVYQTRENGYSTSVRPRLDKLSADLKNIMLIDESSENGEYDPLTMEDAGLRK